ncbi:alanine racemase [Thermosyntropha lipolytica DSM 11003]|uniref:Alanine racemase n=1 Tax=Thermosyntropha lipolytica DSM 11003 TaxID=1123382 RepID=A0A1M5PYY2_9FIRM|nr:alanine racemase [Thermosyntropha lipolytica]SHH07115.1 alanine racemase [Thermosyntropha lipolytica DSM 11003]
MASNYNKWIEIDLDIVRSNLQIVRSKLAEEVRLIAVVKADAYGHGAPAVAQVLYQEGVDFFAVSYLDEALRLRQAGLKASIMLFCPLICREDMMEAIENNLVISITSPEEASLLREAAARLNKMVRVHLKVETGLGRFGLTAEEALEVCRSLSENSCIYLEGIYTHMAHAVNRKYTEKQFSRFQQVIRRLEKEGFSLPVKHCANSAVFLLYPHMHLNAVRIGTLLSGQHPLLGDFNSHLSLKDPYKFKARVISVRTKEKGSYLGYFRTYRLKKESKVAVIPVGFVDGLALEIANPPLNWIDFLKMQIKRFLAYLDVPGFNLQVKINGSLYPVRGKVFMQMALVELPLEADVKAGDEVEIPVRKTLARPDVPRLYIREGEAGKLDFANKVTYLVEEG